LRFLCIALIANWLSYILLNNDILILERTHTCSSLFKTVGTLTHSHTPLYGAISFCLVYFSQTQPNYL